MLGKITPFSLPQPDDPEPRSLGILTPFVAHLLKGLHSFPQSHRTMASETDPKPNSDSPRGSALAKFSGVGIQMLAIIGVFTWLGTWADGRFGSGPWGTVVLMLLGVFLAMYQVIRAVSEK